MALLALSVLMLNGSVAHAVTLDPMNKNSDHYAAWYDLEVKDVKYDLYYAGWTTWQNANDDIFFYPKSFSNTISITKPYLEVEFPVYDFDGEKNDPTYNNGFFVQYEGDEKWYLVAYAATSYSLITNKDINQYGAVNLVKSMEDNSCYYAVWRYFPKYIDYDKKIAKFKVMVHWDSDGDNGSGPYTCDYGITSKGVDCAIAYVVDVKYEEAPFNKGKFEYDSDKPGKIKYNANRLTVSGISPKSTTMALPPYMSETSDIYKDWTVNTDATIYIENEKGKILNKDKTFAITEDVKDKDCGKKELSCTATLDNIDYSQKRRKIEYWSFYRPLKYTSKVSGTTESIDFTQFFRYKKRNDWEKPMPRATALHATSDMWRPSVTLDWNQANSSVYDTDGKWYVYRSEMKEDGRGNLVEDKETRQRLTTLLGDKQKYTDSDISHNTNYLYQVGFVCNKWGELDSLMSVLSDNVRVFVKLDYIIQSPTCSLSQKEDTEQGITLHWQFDKPGKNLDFIIQRCLKKDYHDESDLENIVTVTVKEKDKKTECSYIDKDVNTGVDYVYRIATELEGTLFASDTIVAQLNYGTYLTRMNASKGTEAGVVNIEWVSKQIGTSPTRYNLYRRLIGSTNKDYVLLRQFSDKETTHTFEDKNVFPGNYYEYKVETYMTVEDGYLKNSEMSDEGFCLSSGVISGRITYGTGTAVEGVRVKLVKAGDEYKEKNMFYSMHDVAIDYGMNDNFTKMLFDEGKTSTFQMWVKPGVNDLNPVFLSTKRFMLYGDNRGDNSYELMIRTATDSVATGLRLSLNQYHHLTLSVDKERRFHVNVLSEEDADSCTQRSASPDIQLAALADNYADTLCVGGSVLDGDMTTHMFSGHVDDIRVWNKCLTTDEITANYDRLLAGNESGLMIYWPLDEGVDGLMSAYDYSKSVGIANQRHGTLKRNKINEACVDTIVPQSLSLYAITDTEGNYVIRGVPFAGEGTNYTIVPMKGIHKFSPQHLSRYVSGNSLVHSGADIEDVSSFPMRGRVQYANTNVPVKSVSFYVDGNACARNGKQVLSDDNGEYEISVPIGSHLVEAKLQDHVFRYEGRFSDDPENPDARHTFVEELNDIIFYDETRVLVVGRVVGGDIEGKKPLVLNQDVSTSKNNIGTAQIMLTTTNEKSLNWESVIDGAVTKWQSSGKERPLTADTIDINSKAYVAGIGDRNNEDKFITITTDPKTGEFAVLLPPLEYKVASIKVESNEEITFDISKIPALNATDPRRLYTDTLRNDSGDAVKMFEYNAKLAQTYHSTPTFNVVDATDYDTDEYRIEGEDTPEDGNHNERAFGEKWYIRENEIGEKTRIRLYEEKADKSIDYKFGHPIFLQLKEYKLQLEAYERYVNYDDKSKEPVETIVPLAGIEVRMQNEMSSEQAVRGALDSQPGKIDEIKDNRFKLSDKGTAEYRFITGFPNIADKFTRNLDISYTVNGESVNWGQIDGVVIGALPTGNNFVTAAPDELLMVLRDPPGSKSYATWKKGSSYKRVKSHLKTKHFTQELNTVTHFGVTWIQAQGMMLFTVSEIKNKNDLTIGLSVNESFQDGKQETTVITTTRDISTSSDPEYVGAMADVFIGNSRNYIFGESRSVEFVKEAGGSYKLAVIDGIIQGDSVTTMFNYTQHYIETFLIPNFKKLRNALLTYTTDIASVVNNTTEEKYYTTLKEDDPGYATNNDDKRWGNDAKRPKEMTGRSYTVIPPNGLPDYSYQDMVRYYNNQIEGWERILAQNEKAKVEAIEVGEKTENISFDNGVTIHKDIQMNYSFTTIDHEQVDAIGTEQYLAGLRINEAGVEASETIISAGGHIKTDDTEESDNVGISYTIADNNPTDALSIDVYDISFEKKAYTSLPEVRTSPIFVTRAGQTTQPYEDEVRTKYYDKDRHVISAATMKVENPQIAIEGNSNVTNVPAGGSASYKLKLSNISETNTNTFYTLKVVDSTNPNGANLTIDGLPVGSGRTFYIQGGETLTKTLQLTQTDQSVYDYDDIQLQLRTQWGLTNFPLPSDVVNISAHFVPTCSNIRLKIDRPIVNTTVAASELNKLSMQVSDFDMSHNSFKGFRIQYMAKGANDWTTQKTYWMPGAIEPENIDVNNEVFTEAPVNYTLDMSNFTDGEYLFRAVTICSYGNGELNNESDEITVIKDMSRPVVLGLPNPGDGILNAGDEIFVTFNEDILRDKLGKQENFEVAGALNGARIDHSTALQLGGNAGRAEAQTEGDINLCKQSFTIDMWLNIQAPGTIIEHGRDKNKFIVKVTDKNYLELTIGDNESYTSAEPIETDTWLFLNMAYNYSEGASKFNTMIAWDGEQKTLFRNIDVADYRGIGPLAVGCGMRGSVHELVLWNKAYIIENDTEEMYSSKQPSTPGILGYWKMDEGYGTMAKDKARNRHMITGGNWTIGTGNYSLAFSGLNSHADLDISACPIDNDKDYALEMWFKGTEKEGATIFSVGNDLLALQSNDSGALRLKSGDRVETLGSTNYMDANWHHFALNVLRTGTTTVYIDGEAVKQIASDKIPALQGSHLVLGATREYNAEEQKNKYSNFLVGMIDEVRLWDAKLTAEAIRENMRTRIDTASATGLVLYYPFETITKNDQGLIKCEYSAKDVMDATKEIKKSSVEPSDATPGLKEAPLRNNVPFSFTASDRQIYITLEESAARLEGCTVSFLLKGVQDANGNIMQPVMWTAYINQNRLKWDGDDVAIERSVDDEANKFEVSIMNSGNNTEQWNVSGLPAWLSVSRATGTLKPLERKTITFTVEESTPIGKYETTIYLSGNDAIYEPLVVSLNVKAHQPAWSVNPNDYAMSMNIIGQLEVDNIKAEDPDDILAAFIGEECVGLAQPIYYPRYDAYYTHIIIYGNTEHEDKPVSFKMWDASTGEIYSLVKTSSDVVFELNATTGTMNNPFIWNASEQCEQWLQFKKGWNWISLNVVPKNGILPLDNIFADNLDAFNLVKSNNYFSVPDINENKWRGDLTGIGVGLLYKVHTNDAMEISMYGGRMVPSDHGIRIYNGWNWIGFNSPVQMSVNEALANLDPQDGDIIKTLNSFAMYEGFEWVGTLTTMKPGVGYLYRSVDSQTKTLIYPSARNVYAQRARGMMLSAAQDALAPEFFTPVDVHKYSGSMTMIIKVRKAQQDLCDVEVAAFAGDECRGAIKAMDDGYVFLSIHGDSETMLTLKVRYNDETYVMPTQISFKDDKNYGTIAEPYYLDLEDVTGIITVGEDEEKPDPFNAAGIRVSRHFNGMKIDKKGKKWY